MTSQRCVQLNKPYTVYSETRHVCCRGFALSNAKLLASCICKIDTVIHRKMPPQGLQPEKSSTAGGIYHHCVPYKGSITNLVLHILAHSRIGRTWVRSSCI